MAILFKAVIVISYRTVERMLYDYRYLVKEIEVLLNQDDNFIYINSNTFGHEHEIAGRHVHDVVWHSVCMRLDYEDYLNKKRKKLHQLSLAIYDADLMIQERAVIECIMQGQSLSDIMRIFNITNYQVNKLKRQAIKKISDHIQEKVVLA